MFNSPYASTKHPTEDEEENVGKMERELEGVSSLSPFRRPASFKYPPWLFSMGETYSEINKKLLAKRAGVSNLSRYRIGRK